jgi:hypothetical protein
MFVFDHVEPNDYIFLIAVVASPNEKDLGLGPSKQVCIRVPDLGVDCREVRNVFVAPELEDRTRCDGRLLIIDAVDGS